MTNGVFLLLGTNLGDKWANLEKALDHIARAAGPIVKASSVFESSPWGFTNQPEYLNQVILIDTSLNPNELLDVLLGIESHMGRKRIKKWDPRLIDIDILFYNDLLLQKDGLILPHPHLANRRFTLVPLNEIAPDFIHPVLQKSSTQLLKDCMDDGLVRIAKSPYEV